MDEWQEEEWIEEEWMGLRRRAGLVQSLLLRASSPGFRAARRQDVAAS